MCFFGKKSVYLCRELSLAHYGLMWALSWRYGAIIHE
jgi:hypothetical protein